MALEIFKRVLRLFVVCGLERIFNKFNLVLQFLFTSLQWSLKVSRRSTRTPRIRRDFLNGIGVLWIVMAFFGGRWLKVQMWDLALFSADSWKPDECAHLLTAFTAACSFLLSATGCFPTAIRTISSAYTKINIPFGNDLKMLFMATRNRVTAITELWGTPVTSPVTFDRWLPMRTWKVRPVKKFLIKWSMLPERPQFASYLRTLGVHARL